MKRILWPAAVIVVVATVAFGLLALSRDAEWTTSSPEALAELHLALEARMKFYNAEAREHLEKAVELDPDFVMAKLMLAEYVAYRDPDRASDLMREVRTTDVDGLSPRERFFVEFSALVEEKSYDEAERLLDDYLADRPDDPHVLNLKASEAFHRGELDLAESLNRRLLEISPNWVIAYNQLGYITLYQGRFVESEEYFTSYRFIAPDQANPHDSLAELFMILGRYDEAEREIDAALEIYPEFWASYEHLFLVRGLQADAAGMRQVLERAAETEVWPEAVIANFECTIEAIQGVESKDWEGILESARERCFDAGFPAAYPATAIHRAACLVGDWELADRVEDRLREMVEKKASSRKSDAKSGVMVLTYLEAVRAAVEGDFEDAEARCRVVDERTRFEGAGIGIFKLHNRLLHVEILRALGQYAKAHHVLDQVRAINPVMAAEFEENEFAILGL